jgi:hypothetical protein
MKSPQRLIAILMSFALFMPPAFAAGDPTPPLELDKNDFIARLSGDETAALNEIKRLVVERVSTSLYRAECAQPEGPNGFVLAGSLLSATCGLILGVSGYPHAATKILTGGVLLVAAALGFVVGYSTDDFLTFQVWRAGPGNPRLLASVSGLSPKEQQDLAFAIYRASTKTALTIRLLAQDVTDFSHFKRNLKEVRTSVAKASELGLSATGSVQHLYYKRNLEDLYAFSDEENYLTLSKALVDRVGEFKGDDVFLAHISSLLKTHLTKDASSPITQDILDLRDLLTKRTPDNVERISAVSSVLARLEKYPENWKRILTRLTREIDNDQPIWIY